MKSFTLHLMRHGAPELAGRMLGRTDCPATADGIRACADRAKHLAVEHLVASDLRRARDCATAIATPVVDPRWRELDFGDWDGLHPTEIAQDALSRFWRDPDADPPPGGETWSALVARVAAAIDALPPRPTLVVCHAGPMRAALRHLCGFDLRQAWAFDLPYAALLSLRVWDGPSRHAQVTGLRA